MGNQIKVLTTRDVQGMLKNPSYKEYWERKQIILQKYPPTKEMSREEHNKCMREIADLMWEMDGPFQQFLWENTSEVEKIKQERRAKGNQRKNKAIGESYEI